MFECFSFNPCFSGLASATSTYLKEFHHHAYRFNPCFSGLASATRFENRIEKSIDFKFQSLF